MDYLTSPLFWAALGNIIVVNILLSGDNAVVIALAARSLPPEQQKKAIFLGSAAAIGMRIVLTIFALKLLALPYLKIIGAVLLFYIGVQLMTDDDGDADVHGHATLGAAVKTILVADLVMSLDNVLGVAAAANGNTVLLVAGLAISIPLIIFGSTLILKVIERFPVVITLGAALLGYLAGEMLLGDVALAPWVQDTLPVHEVALPLLPVHLSLAGLAAALSLVSLSWWILRRGTRRGAAG